VRVSGWSIIARLSNAIKHIGTITRATEELVDNFYIVEEQLREIRDDLPAGFY
jgi:hypothetical protein